MPDILSSSSSFAHSTDALFFTLFFISLFFVVLITGTIVYFSFRYHKESDAPRKKGKLPIFWIELTWTAIPLIIVVVIFIWGASLFQRMKQAPKNATEIYVTGKQWMWKIQQPNGRREINELHVPVGLPIKLIMISEDVIHSLFIPSFRVKQDVVPGRYSSLWFLPTKIGKYHLFCTQYCGTSHSKMTGYVFVMDKKDYENWLEGKDAGITPMNQSGETLFTEYACFTCHVAAGNSRGPSLVGVFGSKVQLENGQEVTANEDYLRESILYPSKKIVKGYSGIMPTFNGIIKEEDLNQLVVYIKSLKKG